MVVRPARMQARMVDRAIFVSDAVYRGYIGDSETRIPASRFWDRRAQSPAADPPRSTLSDRRTPRRACFPPSRRRAYRVLVMSDDLGIHVDLEVARFIQPLTVRAHPHIAVAKRHAAGVRARRLDGLQQFSFPVDQNSIAIGAIRLRLLFRDPESLR